MKTIVYYDCLRSIVLLNFTMDGGALFRVRTEARTRVLTEMSEIRLHKNEVGGYAYKDANTLITQIERILERQLFEDSDDGMKGLAIDVGNTLNDYKSTVHIKKRDVLAASRAAAKRASTDDSTVEPEIDNNSNAQDEADRQNVFCLTAIGGRCQRSASTRTKSAAMPTKTRTRSSHKSSASLSGNCSKTPTTE